MGCNQVLQSSTHPCKTGTIECALAHRFEIVECLASAMFMFSSVHFSCIVKSKNCLFIVASTSLLEYIAVYLYP